MFAAPEHVSVEVPLVIVVVRVTLVGDSVQVKPVFGEIESVRLTVPTNPVLVDTVIVDIPEAPARTVTLFGAAVTANDACGTTLNVTVAE